MRKYVVILTGFLFALIISGCGGSKSSVTTIAGITTEPIASIEVTSKGTFYLKNIKGTTTLTFDSTTYTETFPSSTSSSGTWVISNGNIVLTDNVTGTTQTISRIQKETDYWLVYDVSLNTNDVNSSLNGRMYSDSTLASAYDPTQMGGSIQGTPLTLAASPTLFTQSSSELSQPMSITYVNSNFYVADYANNKILKIDSSGNVTTFAGSGSVGSADGNGTGASFYLPGGITTDGTYLYVTDRGNHTIRRITIGNPQTVDTIAGSASSAGSIDATGTSARFNSPWGITTDGANLYVADTGNYIIRKIRLSTLEVTTIAGSSGNSDTVDGTYTNARFVQPTRLTTDGSNLYVVDYHNYGGSAIRKVVISTGSVSLLAGGTGTIPFLFGHLGGITTDGTNLYVGDNSSDLSTTYIRVVDIALKQITKTIDITNTAGTVPPWGFTTNGTHLYYTSSPASNVRYF